MSILDHVGRTPLVPLARVAAAAAVPVLVKCEFLNPGGSLKDRIAVSIVADAEARGALSPGATIVEGTGGNTGVGLALVAAVKGYRLVCVLPEKMSHDKRQALRRLGAEVIVTEDAPPDDPKNFNQVARRLAEENGWFLADQFRNPANVAAHVETTANELLTDVGGPIGAFVTGAGTGGTITGVGRVLKRVQPDARVVLADPVGSKLAGLVTTGSPTPDAKYGLEGMGGSEVPEIMDPAVVDAVERVTDDEAFAMTRRLVREEGLLCGGSSGAAVVAALRVASDPTLAGPVVAVLADSWDRYWSKEWLGEGEQREQGEQGRATRGR
ncbi:MAG: PLP-dependent cysteine synthase family protein [Planctomycetota bacterium JB042]